MSDAALSVLDAGPGLTIQDLGRPGYQRYGVCEGGAVDRLAFSAGAALLGNPTDAAAIEIFGQGGRFQAIGRPLRCALTGPLKTARIGDRTINSNASFLLEVGETLTVNPVVDGNFGYLHVGGGFDTEPVLGSRSTHVRARLGGLDGGTLKAGSRVPVGPDPGGPVDLSVDAGGAPKERSIRVLWGAQAHLYSAHERQRFANTEFSVTAKLDRMGIRLKGDGPPFHAESALTGLSDAVSLGDIQVPGDGDPAVLLADRQPTGGYPRIATVITADLAALVQHAPGTKVRFAPVTEAEAIQALERWRSHLSHLPEMVAPLRRDPYDIPNLLELNLIGGVVSPEPPVGKSETDS